MKKLAKAGILGVAILPSIVFAGQAYQDRVIIHQNSYTYNFVPGSSFTLYAPFNTRYNTLGSDSAASGSFVTLSGSAGGPITLTAKSAPAVSGTTCTQCRYNLSFSCTIDTTSALYATASDLLKSANVGVKIISGYTTFSAGKCTSLSAENSSVYLK